MWGTNLVAIIPLSASVQGAINAARTRSPADAQTVGVREENMVAAGANVAANFGTSILPHVCARGVAPSDKRLTSVDNARRHSHRSPAESELFGGQVTAHMNASSSCRNLAARVPKWRVEGKKIAILPADGVDHSKPSRRSGIANPGTTAAAPQNPGTGSPGTQCRWSIRL